MRACSTSLSNLISRGSTVFANGYMRRTAAVSAGASGSFAAGFLPVIARFMPSIAGGLAYRDHHQRRYCKSARNVSISLFSSITMPSAAPVIARQSLIILRLMEVLDGAPRCALMVNE